MWLGIEWFWWVGGIFAVIGILLSLSILIFNVKHSLKMMRGLCKSLGEHHFLSKRQQFKNKYKKIKDQRRQEIKAIKKDGNNQESM